MIIKTFRVALLFVALLSFYPGGVQVQAWSSPRDIYSLTLEEVALSALEGAFQDQVTDSKDPVYLPGEFRTKIRSTLVPVLVGVGKGFGYDDEATAFTTAAVVNNLAGIYLDFPELKSHSSFRRIPGIIRSAVKTYPRYKGGSTYNFYPPLKLADGTTVRRPRDMTLFPLWHGFTNIPNDSDTTSSVLTSLIYDGLVNQKPFVVVDAALQEIATYSDQNRSAMFYNRGEGRVNTGGYMTWLMDEYDPEMPRFYFARSKEGKRIPFNKNDVDCIVNVNILKLESLSKKHIPGSEKSCEMINDMVAKDESATCGVYYPNTYNLAYSLASAKKMGNTCLVESNKELLLQKILKEQTAEGAWVNLDNIWKDQILSTAFALTALIELGNPNEPSVHAALKAGLSYLLSQVKLVDGLAQWEPDNFFTATAIARSLIMWKSKAFTQSVISSLLFKVHKLYPEYKVQNYVELSF